MNLKSGPWMAWHKDMSALTNPSNSHRAKGRVRTSFAACSPSHLGVKVVENWANSRCRRGQSCPTIQLGHHPHLAMEGLPRSTQRHYLYLVLLNIPMYAPFLKPQGPMGHEPSSLRSSLILCPLEPRLLINLRPGEPWTMNLPSEALPAPHIET